MISSTKPAATEVVESTLDSIEEKVQAAIDVGLENRQLLKQLTEGEETGGLGAIHSLDEGRVQLTHPLIYRYEVLDDEVLVGITELGVYGVGATEGEAVAEMRDELWSLAQDLERMPIETLGPHLRSAVRTLRARIQRNAVDA